MLAQTFARICPYRGQSRCGSEQSEVLDFRVLSEARSTDLGIAQACKTDQQVRTGEDLESNTN